MPIAYGKGHYTWKELHGLLKKQHPSWSAERIDRYIAGIEKVQHPKGKKKYGK